MRNFNPRYFDFDIFFDADGLEACMHELELANRQGIYTEMDEWGLLSCCVGDVGVEYNFDRNVTEDYSGFYVIRFDGQYWDTCTDEYTEYLIDQTDPGWKEHIVEFAKSLAGELFAREES